MRPRCSTGARSPAQSVRTATCRYLRRGDVSRRTRRPRRTTSGWSSASRSPKRSKRRLEPPPRNRRVLPGTRLQWFRRNHAATSTTQRAWTNALRRRYIVAKRATRVSFAVIVLMAAAVWWVPRYTTGIPAFQAERLSHREGAVADVPQWRGRMRRNDQRRRSCGASGAGTAGSASSGCGK